MAALRTLSNQIVGARPIVRVVSAPHACSSANLATPSSCQLCETKDEGEGEGEGEVACVLGLAVVVPAVRDEG